MRTQTTPITPYTSIVPKKAKVADIKAEEFKTSENAVIEVQAARCGVVCIRISPAWSLGSPSLREAAALFIKLAKAIERSE